MRCACLTLPQVPSSAPPCCLPLPSPAAAVAAAAAAAAAALSLSLLALCSHCTPSAQEVLSEQLLGAKQQEALLARQLLQRVV
jgi:hypothetical protein